MQFDCYRLRIAAAQSRDCVCGLINSFYASQLLRTETTSARDLRVTVDLYHRRRENFVKIELEDKIQGNRHRTNASVEMGAPITMISIAFVVPPMTGT